MYCVLWMLCTVTIVVLCMYNVLHNYCGVTSCLMYIYNVCVLVDVLFFESLSVLISAKYNNITLHTGTRMWE